jgi:site-specific DNA-methyltransferase (adenine-specific)
MSNIQLLNECNMQVMARYPDKYFDLAIVDPPYRDENQPTKDMRSNGSMKSLEGRPTSEYWTELKRVSKEQIIWGANNFELPQWKGFVVYKKKTISENFTMSMCEVASLSDGLSTTSKFVEFAPQDPNRIHPTQKAVALYKWLLKHYATPDMKLLDTHLGSMSSVIAAYDFGVSEFVGCEIDAEYFEKGKARFEQHKRQLNLFAA